MYRCGISIIILCVILLLGAARLAHDLSGVFRGWGSDRRLSSVDALHRAYRNQASGSTDNPLGLDTSLRAYSAGAGLGLSSTVSQLVYASDLSAAALSPSARTHAISFRVQDDESEWAGPGMRARLVGSLGPDIRVTPIAVNTTLPEGLSVTVPLTISNVGDATLAFTITKEQGSRGAGEPGGTGDGDPSTTLRTGMGGKGKKEKGKKGEGLTKVDPALRDVLDAATDSRVTLFVYLKEQADPSTSSGQALSPAYGIEDWKARGEFVYRTLRETAQRSQDRLLADLEARKLAGQVTRVQPFFIVNAIAVTGDRSTVEALATHPDVAHLAPEPALQISSFPLAPRGSQPAIRNPKPVLSPVEVSEIRNPVEWNIAKIRADQVWADFGVTGAGVVGGQHRHWGGLHPSSAGQAVSGRSHWQPRLQLVRSHR